MTDDTKAAAMVELNKLLENWTGPAVEDAIDVLKKWANGIGPAQVIRLDHIKLPTTIPWVTA